MSSIPIARPVAIEYARVGADQLDPRVQLAARWMTSLSILSGLCVGTCFLLFTGHPLAVVLHVGLYAVTLVVGVRTGILTGAAGYGSTALRLLDGVASLGLIMIAVAPVVAYWMDESDFDQDRWPVALLGLAFLFLAGSTFRHVLLYNDVLAHWSTSAGRPGFAKALKVLGWFKFIYEGIWLLCCAVPPLVVGVTVRDLFPEQLVIVLAVGALLGALGFGVVWIWMIVMHAVLASKLRRATALS